VKLKIIIRIMENECKGFYPSSRYNKEAGYSVSWKFVFLSGGGLEGDGQREN
jgi:hypothetical protein